MERLHKLLARAGIGSRRECERLIMQGEVQVNGQRVTQPGLKVDPADCAVKVRGKLVKLAKSHQTASHYYVLYKPRGCLTMVKPDSQGRQTLLDLLDSVKTRVYPVGRLDFNSEGLILLTDDGELAYRLTHPKFKVPKTYAVKVRGIPSDEALKKLSQGVILKDGKTAPASVKISRITGKNAWLSFTIREGKKRQIRRMCKKVRLPVSKLKRIAYGPLKLKGLKQGEVRALLPEEIQLLKRAVKLQ